MRKIFIIVLLLLSACAPEIGATYGANETGDTPTTKRLAVDYEFTPYPGSQWYQPNGEPVPAESGIINAIMGPDHCDWESGVMLHLGWPLGHDAADSSELRQYFRDPQSVFPQDSLIGTFKADVKLPDTAENSGYRTDFMELWLDPNDDSAAYLVFAQGNERWPRGSETIARA